MTIDPPFENTYASLPTTFFHEATPEKVDSPQLIGWNQPLAEELNVVGSPWSESLKGDLTLVFSGNRVPPRSEPIAMAYSGHQFGHFSPLLGDGRALLLGELRDTSGVAYDVQLKGSGRTVFSRGGDGKSPLGPVLREFIVSEAMYHLGVPTTRSLAAVSTGETVYREEAQPGGVLTRVAKSHVRVGTFQLFASQNDRESLNTLLHYLAERCFPELKNSKDLPLDFLKSLVAKQTRLVAQWMSLGFIHGVMNTDNTSAIGITLDYGPCAFLDETDFDKVFSSIDRRGRYAYGNQPKILQWNLTRLAECLILLYPDEQREKMLPLFEQALHAVDTLFQEEWQKLMLAKLGLKGGDTSKRAPLLNDWMKYMNSEKVDFTMGFRKLTELLAHGTSDIHPMNEVLKDFIPGWKSEILKDHPSVDEACLALNKTNPNIIPRNHKIEQMILQAYNGDFSLFEKMSEAIKDPFTESELSKDFTSPPHPSERVQKTFCGT